MSVVQTEIFSFFSNTSDSQNLRFSCDFTFVKSWTKIIPFEKRGINTNRYLMVSSFEITNHLHLRKTSWPMCDEPNCHRYRKTPKCTFCVVECHLCIRAACWFKIRIISVSQLFVFYLFAIILWHLRSNQWSNWFSSTLLDELANEPDLFCPLQNLLPQQFWLFQNSSLLNDEQREAFDRKLNFFERLV